MAHEFCYLRRDLYHISYHDDRWRPQTPFGYLSFHLFQC